MRADTLQRAVELLRDLARLSSEPRLPSLRTLSGEHKIGYDSLLAAARQLRSEGVLEFRRGSGLRLGKHPCTDPVADKLTAAQKLFEQLRNDIETGHYRTGEQMPKRIWVASENRVSVNSVSAAYILLERAGLIRRDGKCRRVGAKAALSAAHSKPVIVLFMPRPRHWYGISISQRTEPMGHTLTNLATRNGIRLVPALPTGNHMSVDSLAIGAVVRRLNSESRRWLGILATGTVDEYPDLPSDLGELSSYGRPIAWFDRNGSGGDVPLPQKVVRFAYDEKKVCRAAVRHLYTLGHRRAAFLCDFSTAWQMERFRMLQTVLEEFAGMVVVACPVHNRTRWGDTDVITGDLAELESLCLPYVKHAFSRFSSISGELDREIAPECFDGLDKSPYRRFVAYSRWALGKEGLADDVDERWRTAREIWTGMHISAVLTDSTMTALILPSDRVGYSFQRWFQRNGVSCPGRLSLLSFDNHYRYDFPRLSSVDYGFEVLAYKAFHFIVGDLATGLDSSQTVHIDPIVADHESTGPLPAN